MSGFFERLAGLIKPDKSDDSSPRLASGAKPENLANSESLLRYLAAAVQFNRGVMKNDLSTFDKVVWLSEFPESCRLLDWQNDNQELELTYWLKVRRPSVQEKMPVADDDLCRWIKSDELANPVLEGGPALQDAITISGKYQRRLDDLDDADEIRQKFSAYIERWMDWAAKERVNQAGRVLYEKIFAVCQMLENEDEVYESVLGFALLLWAKAPDADSSEDQVPEKPVPIRRHLFTVSISVEKDSKDGSITIGYPASGGSFQYEDEMLRENQRLQSRDRERLLSELKLFNRVESENEKTAGTSETFSSPDIGQLNNLIKLWITAYPSANYSQDINPPGIDQATEIPLVTLAPALILRKRDLRGMTRFIEKASAQLCQRPGSYSPALVAMAGESFSGEVGKKIDNDVAMPALEVPRLYFPLPAGDEQLSVGKKLNDDNGLMIVGPPGTGKSTLIANAICHFLASGKRILVTSEAVRPLQVLRDMLPARLRNLCVSYLGDSDRSQTCLRDSIAAIRSEFSKWNRNNNIYQDKITESNQQLDALAKRESEVKNRLIELQNRAVYSELSEIEYKGSLGMLAAELERERCNHEWIMAGCGQECSLEIVKPDPRYSDDRFKQFLSEVIFFIKLDRQILVPSSKLLGITLPEPEIVKEKCAALRQARADIIVPDPVYSTIFEALIKIDVSPIELMRQDLARIIDTVPEEFFRSDSISEKWNRLAAECCFGDSVRWSELLQYTESEIVSLNELLSEIKGGGDGVVAFVPVTESGEEPPENFKKILKIAERLYDYFNSYIKLPFTDRLSDEELEHNCIQVELVTVDNAKLDRNEGRKAVRKWLARVIVSLRLDFLDEKWQTLGVSPVVGGFAIRLEKFSSVIGKTKELRNIASLFQEKFTAVCGSHGLLFSEIEMLPAIDLLLTSVIMRKHLEVQEEEYKSLVDTVCSNDGNSHNDFILEQVLTTLLDEDESGYVDAVKLWDKRGDVVCTLNDLAGVFPDLDGSVVSLAEKIVDRFAGDEDNSEDNGNDISAELSGLSLQDAWFWAWRRIWLLKENLKANPAQLKIELHDIKKETAETLAQISADRAWVKCVEGLDEDFHNNLNSWKNSIDHLPKDKKAKKYLHILNGAMLSLRKCSPAVPGWVMPLQLAVEWFSPANFSGNSPELHERPFDVVIMDEASQSRVEALVLFMLARKVIVIGDQKQNMPSGVGLAENLIRDMINNNLTKDFPKRYMLRYDYCFLEIYANFFRFEEVNLREHYRCDPEIIGFCNENFYTGNEESLYPLRQPDIDWSRPAIKTVYVPEGCMTVGRDRKINIPEAEAIVEEVKSCCSQAIYRKTEDGSLKSMGIISLQGGEQAELIMQKLQSGFVPSAEEILQRRLNSGTSRAFQGDQRDIIFLSLVASRKTADGTENRLSAQTTKESQRLYNVAVSRAREQLWLFHSVCLDELSPQDLRYKLLEYCLRKEGKETSLKADSGGIIGSVQDTAKGRLQTPAEISLYRESAESEKRCFDNFPVDVNTDMPFDSWFELDVFLDLVDLGCEVIPQFPAFGSDQNYCIDLVVLSNGGRVAVECDGLKYHNYNASEEVFRHDLERQIALERCGWVFYRLRASVYYLDPEVSIIELDKEMDKQFKLKSDDKKQIIIEPIEEVVDSDESVENKQPAPVSGDSVEDVVMSPEESENTKENEREAATQMVIKESEELKIEPLLESIDLEKESVEIEAHPALAITVEVPIPEKITDALLDALRNDPDPDVRQAIALALIESKTGWGESDND